MESLRSFNSKDDPLKALELSFLGKGLAFYHPKVIEKLHVSIGEVSHNTDAKNGCVIIQV